MQRVVCPNPQSRGANKIFLATGRFKKPYFYKGTFKDMRTFLKNNITRRLLLVGLMAGLLQGCSSSKKCGCGSDINRAYVPRTMR
jgi:hypothetical protein